MHVMQQVSGSTGAICRTCALGARPQAARHARRKVTCMAISYDKVAGAYANALIDLAQEKGTLDTVHSDIDALSSAFKENKDVTQFLNDPMVPAAKKKEVLGSLAKDISEDTRNFMCLLLDLDRLVAVERIFDSFQETYCRVTQTQVVNLRAAVQLKQEQLFLIAKKLQELTGSKNVKLQPSIDKSLIAGFVLEFGSSQIDLSIKGQLAKIEAELLEQEFASA